KTPGAFSLQGGRVVKSATPVGFADNVVYRPEAMLDGEASVEVRFSSLPPGYAQVFVRGQPETIGVPGLFTGYLPFIDDSASRAYLDRIEDGQFVVLRQITLSPGLNTTDTFRLRLRATGTSPVVVAAYVVRLTASGWTVIGEATVTDTSATRVAAAGYAGFTGYLEGGRYSYDNYAQESFDGENPQPQVTGLLPESVLAGSGGLTLTVTGEGFVPESQVLWNGAARSTTFVSPTELRASIGAGDVATAGTASVTVASPAPGGGESGAATFTIEALAGNPVPVVEALSPSTAVAGDAGFVLTVTGEGFVPAPQVLWNAAVRATTYVSPTELQASITADDIAAIGTAAVAVQSPGPGGGTSNVESFLVTGAGGSFFDDFERADGADLGNGWVEKTPGAFSLQGG